jgi:hypothetical protein
VVVGQRRVEQQHHRTHRNRVGGGEGAVDETLALRVAAGEVHGDGIALDGDVDAHPDRYIEYRAVIAAGGLPE